MKRLHVIVRNDLPSLGYMAAQSGHAVANYLIEHKPHINGCWNNDYLIILQASGKQLKNYVDKLDYHGIIYSRFNEPDLNNKLTAIAVLNNGKMFKKLKTL